jgi:hypothetical protein
MRRYKFCKSVDAPENVVGRDKMQILLETISKISPVGSAMVSPIADAWNSRKV